MNTDCAVTAVTVWLQATFSDCTTFWIWRKTEAVERDRQVNASEREEHRPNTLTQHCHLTTRFVVQISWSAAHAPCDSTVTVGVADTGTEVLSVSANGLLLWNSARTGTTHTSIHHPPADVTSQLNNIKHASNNELRVWLKSFKHLYHLYDVIERGYHYMLSHRSSTHWLFKPSVYKEQPMRRTLS